MSAHADQNVLEDRQFISSLLDEMYRKAKKNKEWKLSSFRKNTYYEMAYNLRFGRLNRDVIKGIYDMLGCVLEYDGGYYAVGKDEKREIETVLDMLYPHFMAEILDGSLERELNGGSIMNRMLDLKKINEWYNKFYDSYKSPY